MNPRLDEIVLLTHEWDSMRAWWGTLTRRGSTHSRSPNRGRRDSRVTGCHRAFRHFDERQSRSRWGHFTHGLDLRPRSLPSTSTRDSSRSAPATTAPQTTPAECACGTATPMAPTWQFAYRSTPTRTTGVARRSIPITSSPGWKRRQNQRMRYTPTANRTIHSAVKVTHYDLSRGRCHFALQRLDCALAGHDLAAGLHERRRARRGIRDRARRRSPLRRCG